MDGTSTTTWTVFLISAPGVEATPGGSFASREDALAWIRGLPDDVRRRAMPPLPLPQRQRTP
jgi:hypothetical protein